RETRMAPTHGRRRTHVRNHHRREHVMATIRRIHETFSSEAELATQVEAVMSTYFHIEREVPSQTPDGKRVRLDAVYFPRDPIAWRDETPMFAVEYKQPKPSFDTR